MNFQGRNLEGYITITLDYEDTNWHQASMGLYANNK
jgi:hypothetical protein